MATCHATANSTVRRYETRRAEFSRRMLRLYRASRLLLTSLQHSGPRTYQIDPGDVIFFRDAVERARLAVELERNAE